MSIANLPIGSQIALGSPASSAECAPGASAPSSLGELLEALAVDPPNSMPMLRSTASKIAECCNRPVGDIALDQVAEIRSQLRKYLRERKYAETSIRSYINYVRILIKAARQLGWRRFQGISDEWQRVLALASKRKCAELARFFVLIKKTPRDVTAEEVEGWAETALEGGARSRKVNAKKGQFWRVLRECGMTDYLPLSTVQRQVYKVHFEQLPNQFRSELDRLLKWKTADFSPDRPKGGQIRQETAEKIRENVCQIYGFATRIRGLSEIASMPQLVSKGLVTDYVSWCINERSVKGETLRNHLGRIDVAMRQHPAYASLDLRWFKLLLESLPIEPESERRMRKAKKYLDYEVLEAIPLKIHTKRLTAPVIQAAWLAMEELLIRWFLALPWRQRNVRECRIGGSRPNIFRAKIPKHIPIDTPEWILAEDQKNPGAVFWQMHFVAKETKMGREINAFLPRQLIGPLEQYLKEFRPRLLKNGDPGTLFVTREGSPMSRDGVYSLVTRITSDYGGRSVNPHLIRDIVAFAWLKAHPKDYLTLSKILWHANINVTIRTYGSRFDESSGVCAMESWLDEREARAKSK